MSTMKTWSAGEPEYWIGEYPVYPGHPVTCALIVLLAYPGDSLRTAWTPNAHGTWTCEGELDTPTAGGALSVGCELIRHVLNGTMTADEAVAWGQRDYHAGGHADKVAPGIEQAERLVPRLREALRRVELMYPIERVDADGVIYCRHHETERIRAHAWPCQRCVEAGRGVGPKAVEAT